MPGRDRIAELAERRRAIEARVEAAGGDPGAVTVVAVTKNRPVEDCAAAAAAGFGVLAENRVQEAVAKIQAVPEVEWHLVGHLQSNKAAAAAERFAVIQSVDSLRLAEALKGLGRPGVLVQVNCSREPQKHGFAPEAAVDAVVEIAALLDVRGLMTMAAAEGDPRPAFRLLRRLRDRAQDRLGRALPELSMGMSGDFEAAVAEGSTMVRIGRALFDP